MRNVIAAPAWIAGPCRAGLGQPVLVGCALVELLRLIVSLAGFQLKLFDLLLNLDWVSRRGLCRYRRECCKNRADACDDECADAFHGAFSFVGSIRSHLTPINATCQPKPERPAKKSPRLLRDCVKGG